jgi:hypothetical protein
MSFAALSAAACAEAPADPLPSSASLLGGGGSGGAGGDACGACLAHERCVDGACAPIKVLRINVEKGLEQYPPNPVDVIESGVTACYYERIAVPSSPTPPLSGTCIVKDPTAGPPPPEPLFESILADAGPIMIAGPKLGQLVLDSVTKPASACGLDARSINPFEDGEEVTISSPGGADFPAFSSTLEAPAAPILHAGALVRGEPFPMEWSGSSTEHFWLIIVPLGEQRPSIECQVPDTGSYTVPAEVTAALDWTYPQAAVIAGRGLYRTVHDDSIPTEVTTSVAVYTFLWIDYIPGTN